ncbi:MAG: zinc metalloprotease [Planctomycetota bacterium]|jgi:hypothetical protein
MFTRLTEVAVACVVIVAPATGDAEDYLPPERVEVLPVFFVPKDQPAPNADQRRRLMRHLRWSQDRYSDLLDHRDTFSVAKLRPDVYRAVHPLSFYRKQPEGPAPHVVSELLEHYRVNRFTCPYVFLVVVMNPHDRFPVGGGRPLNGGYDTGGGIVVISSFALDRIPNFQSTLQHELGHGFGLLHVDAYGYDMKTNRSVMAYNPVHKTRGFEPAVTPGVLIPEDVRALAMNGRGFPKLRFDASRDVPPGYALTPLRSGIPPMKIPGQVDNEVLVTTDSPERNKTSVSNVVQGRIRPNRGPGITFSAAHMWATSSTSSDWAWAKVTFPVAVKLTAVSIHSEHSGKYNMAKRVRIEVRSEATFRELVEQEVASADEYVTLPATEAQTWKFGFRAGSTGGICVRGLRFFSDGHEIFPPLIPYRAENGPLEVRPPQGQ